MVLYSKFTDGFQFSGEKKRFVNPLNVSQVTAILVIQEDSCGFFKNPVEGVITILSLLNE